jgi:hypothetical protein
MKIWSTQLPINSRTNPNNKGISNILAYYLMTVNGIPRKHLTTMEKNVRNFIWNGRKGQMAWQRATLPVKEGGINAPSVKLIYETIKVGWLKRWWRPEPDRPDWAWIANDMVFQSANDKPRVTKSTITEWICQTWPIKPRSEHLTNSLREMIEASTKIQCYIVSDESTGSSPSRNASISPPICKEQKPPEQLQNNEDASKKITKREL